MIGLDHNYCRTRNMSNNLWECLTYKGIHCEYRIHSGTEQYCSHNDCASFSIWSHANNAKQFSATNLRKP